MTAKICKRWPVVIAMAVVTLLAFTGCGKSMEGIQVLDYKITAGSAETLKNYAGLIGIPEEDNSPVVFILHGAHSLEGGIDTPYYTGFEYLVKTLAENGYLAISIDTNNAYTGDSEGLDEYTRVKREFQEHYNQLMLANDGKNVFPVSMKGKADFSKINMIGHSRGGDNITRIIADPDFATFSFKSAIKITAAGNSPMRDIYADVPTALIYSQYDEDIPDTASAATYYFAYESDLARRTPIISAFLYGANHAAFNTKVTAGGMTDFGDEAEYIDPETQREFVEKLALDFLSVNNKDAKLFEVFNNETTDKYGIDFMLSIHDPYGDRVLAPDKYMQGLSAQGVDLQYVESSINESKNTTGAFNLPGAPAKLPLYSLTWDEAGGKLSIPLDGIFYHLNEEKVLALYLALNSADSRNSPDSPSTFDVVITDVEGKSATVPFSSATNAALRYQAGEVVEINETIAKWKFLTPLGTELIPLKQFSGKLMIDSIASITIVPTSKTGALMLAGIDVYSAS